jgi:preprotein translocase SecE subunit|tara:strand:- start:45 stop:251 length:207 start_codon:yes stop_codon:yes gene_type:complete
MAMNPADWARSSREYLGDVQGEYQKITWPPQAEAIAGTLGVAAVVTVVTIALGLVDFVLSRIMQYLLN